MDKTGGRGRKRGRKTGSEYSKKYIKFVFIDFLGASISSPR